MRSKVAVLGALLVACSAAKPSVPAPEKPTSAETTPKKLATPQPEDLAPIEIPVSPLRSSSLGRELLAACDAVMNTTFGEDEKPLEPTKELAITATKLHTAQQRVVELERLAVDKRPKVELDKLKLERDGASSALNGPAKSMAKACAAIRGERAFDANDVTTLRKFRDAPQESTTIVTLGALRASAEKSSASPPTVGSLESYLINGLATFIYNRAKAESLDYIAQSLKRKLCDSAVSKAYFANICVAFGDLSEVALPALASYLGMAARKDLVRMPDVALAFGIANSASTTPLVAARIGYAYFAEVARGRSPLEVARALRLVKLTKEQVTKGGAMVTTIKLGSELIDAVLQQEGLAAIDVRDLPYYAAAVLFTLDREGQWAGTLTPDLLNRKLVGGASAAELIRSLLEHIDELRRRTETIAEQLAATRAELIEADDTDEKANARANEKRAMSQRELAQVATAVIGDLVATTGELIGDRCKDECKVALRILHRLTRFGEQLLSEAAPAELAVSFLDFADVILGAVNNPQVSEIRKVLPILAQFARAKSSDDVVATLEAAVPARGYAQKALRPTVSISAMVGGGGGVEWLARGDRAFSTGIIAPVGIHLSCPWWGNIGLLASILNLGNVVAARFADEMSDTDDGVTTTVSSEEAMQVEQVFSPGVFATKSMGKSPFTVGIGAQFVPSAREVTVSSTVNGEVVERSEFRSAFQLLLFVGVDVSLWSF